MDICKIQYIGQFDRICIDGWLDPLYRNSGVEISDNMNFCEAVENSGLAHLKLNILGECDSLPTVNPPCPTAISSSTNRYLIAYADILIMKSGELLPDGLKNERSIDEFRQLAKSDDELNIYIAGTKLCKYIASSKDVEPSSLTVAVIDRVYVYKAFRKLGISTWLHTNIVDIVNTFGMVKPDLTVMTYGDFARESKRDFGMTVKSYRDMLAEHYKHLGYKKMSSIIWFIADSDSKDIFFKLNG